ncbi:MAG TPA: metal ABC transporter permease [Opitutaceae bacterium]
MTFHQLFIEPFSYQFMQRGLLSAVLLSLSGGLLGGILVLRRLALMGDALAHSLLPGVALAYLFFGASLPALFAGALVAGLLTAGGSAFLSRLTRVKEDAAFGSLFIIFFALGVVLVSAMRSRIDLMHFLFGNILAVSRPDLLLSAAVSATTLGTFIVFYRPILLETFDPIFHRATGGRGSLTHVALLALTVLNLIAALQAMGVVLALGLFLLPAVSAYLWCDSLGRMLTASVGIALGGSVMGIFASYHAGLASGATIVLSLGGIFIVSAIISPRYGLAVRLWKARGTGKGVLRSPD